MAGCPGSSDAKFKTLSNILLFLSEKAVTFNDAMVVGIPLRRRHQQLQTHVRWYPCTTMMTMKGFRIYFPAAKYAGVQTGIHFPKGFTSVKKVLFYYVYNIFRYGARHEISSAMIQAFSTDVLLG